MVDVPEGETQRVRAGAHADLWSGIVRAACTLAELEPALRPMLFETVLPDWRPEAVVGAVAAGPLKSQVRLDFDAVLRVIARLANDRLSAGRGRPKQQRPSRNTDCKFPRRS